jgi:hypothetical protein
MAALTGRHRAGGFRLGRARSGASDRLVVGFGPGVARGAKVLSFPRTLASITVKIHDPKTGGTLRQTA